LPPQFDVWRAFPAAPGISKRLDRQAQKGSCPHIVENVVHKNISLKKF